MGIIILVSILVGVPLGFFLQSYLLYLTTRILKVDSTTYKKAMAVILYTCLVYIPVAIVFGVVSVIIPIVKNNIIGGIFGIVAGFFISNFFYKKYYQTDIKKNIKIYISYGIFSALVSVFLAVGVVVPIRMFIVQPFFVQGAAMVPTFNDGAYLLIKEYDKDYKRGEIVVFKYPKDEKQFFIKRIIGMPGETIEINQGVVYINGNVLDESSYLSKDVATKGAVSLTLGADQYFVMGDNRQFSSDSRAWGALNKNLITGKYWFAPGISMK